MASSPAPSSAPSSSASGNPYVQQAGKIALSQAEALRPFAAQGLTAADFQGLVDPAAATAAGRLYPRLAFDNGPGGGQNTGTQIGVDAENITRVSGLLHAFLGSPDLSSRLPTLFAHPFAAPGRAASPALATPAQLVGAYRDMFPTVQQMLRDPSLDRRQIPDQDPQAFVEANNLFPDSPGIPYAKSLISSAATTVTPPIQPASVTPLYVQNVPIHGAQPSASAIMVTTISRETDGSDKVRYWVLMPVGDYLKYEGGRVTPGSAGQPGDLFYPVLASTFRAQ